MDVFRNRTVHFFKNLTKATIFIQLKIGKLHENLLFKVRILPPRKTAKDVYSKNKTLF